MADEETTPDAGGTAVADAPEKLPQQVEISDAGPCKKHVKVTVDRGAIDARLDEKFSDLVLNSPAQVAGFRVGKAPRKIIEKRFFKEVSADVKTEVLMASLEQLAEEQSLSPLSPPELDPHAVVIPEAGPLVYEFDIEVRPEFDLPDYNKLKLRRPTHAFTDADVARESKAMLEPQGQIVPKANQTVEPGDILVADVAISRDGKELNKLTEVRLKADKKLALSDGVADDFAAKMTGAKPGDTRTVDITLSQQMTNESLRGAKVQGAFTVKDVKTVRLPELTADVLDQFGVRSEEQFHELVRSRLERYLEYVQRQTARQQVLELLAGDAKWELPRDLLVKQSRKTLIRRVMEMRSAGIPDEQIAARQRVLEQDAVKTTAAALKEHFVLQKIAETEKLEVEDQDIEGEIDRIADQTGESRRKVKARMEKEDLVEALATELLERKALDHVLATAEYEDYAFNPVEQDAADSVSSVEAQAVPGEATEPTANG
jgi:trigger factor